MGKRNSGLLGALVLVVAALIFCATRLPALAQDPTVTISAAEFQHLAYSAHLYTQIAEKPELDASLEVLLELHRRNPHLAPEDLAGMLANGLHRYRANAPAYLRTNGFRDEILTAYLDALRPVPKPAGFVSADMALLNRFMLQPGDYATGSAAELIHSGNQRLLSGVNELANRQDLLDACTRRAEASPGFAEAMDGLLYPELLVSVTNTPAQIIGNPNSPLHGNCTMTNLLAFSLTNGGSVTISSNTVKALFAAETRALWDIAHTNLALVSEFNQSQPDLAAYLTNQAAQAYWTERQAAVRQGQARAIAAASAAVLVQSQLTAAPESQFKLPEWMVPVGNVGGALLTAYGSGGLNLGPLVSSTIALVGMFVDTSESPDEQIVREIGNIQTMISDLSINMNYRFDRVDQSLTTIFDTLNQEFSKIEITLDAQGRLVAQLNGSVDDIRANLVDVQTDLHRLERHLLSYVNQLYGRFASFDFNRYLGYEVNYPPPVFPPMSASEYADASTKYFTHARVNSVDGLSSPYLDRDYTAPGLYWELLESGGGTTNRLDQNLSYIKKYLADRLGQPTAGTLGELANPRDWFVGTYAYLQLNLENPRYFHAANISNRADLIMQRASDLTNFFRSLAFTGANINSSLYTALENYYDTELSSFAVQVANTETDYASTTNFALNTWRQWSIASPRVTAPSARVLVAQPRNLIAAGNWHSLLVKPDGRVGAWGSNIDGPVGNDVGQSRVPGGLGGVIAVAAAYAHSLALKADGTVVGWGDNASGAIAIPAAATDVVAIAGNGWHSLALKADGTVVAWGYGWYGQTNVPAGLTDVVAIAAGRTHSLASKADGTVVAWGYNDCGQTDVPADLTNAVGVVAGEDSSLALKADGTLVAWGYNEYGERDIPLEATNVVAIAGSYHHFLALKADGTVVAWGLNSDGQADVPANLSSVVAIAAGTAHSLALKADGTVVAWGSDNHGQCNPRGWLASPRVRSHIAAGTAHSLAVKADGTVVGWGAGGPGTSGDYNHGQTTIPPGLKEVVAVAAGGHHSLALKANGTVVGWGWDLHQQIDIPSSATNGVTLAAGEMHSLALRADGTVVAWGWNYYGQTTVPAGLSNVVAIAAGQYHSLALKADGTVVGWGDNSLGATTIPPDATNLIAIAAGSSHSLGLKADGTVIGWGDNRYLQTAVPASATNVVAIAAGSVANLALRADGTVVGWGLTTGLYPPPAGLSDVVAIAVGDDPAASQHRLVLKSDGKVLAWGGANAYGQATVPPTVIDLSAWGEHCPGPASSAARSIAAVAAGSAHAVELAADGSVLAWGLNTWGQTTVPPQAQSGVQAVTSGLGHSLALLTNGSVLAWGLNDFGQTNVPASAQGGVLVISAGAKHNLALKTDGTVVAWGLNSSGQTSVPTAIQGRVVAIAAGGEHSLALNADGALWAWGGNSSGQTDVPLEAQSGVVAIAAGRYHSLALTFGGRVVAWGLNSSGQTSVPVAAQSGVVAIAAGITHSLALKRDGTLVVWGSGPPAFVPRQAWNNVVAIAAGDQYSVLLTADEASTPGLVSQSFARAQIPVRVAQLFRNANDYLIAELGRVGELRTAGAALSGTKALLSAVLELGMPYTLERDEVLHGFIYGSESLMDLTSARNWRDAENARLERAPQDRPWLLCEAALLRSQCFRDRLSARLNDLQATGQPEIPRLVAHTLRLLSLLRDAWTRVPPPSLELRYEIHGLDLVLYGEPYMHYTLQYRDNLNLVDWTSTTITNLHSEQNIAPPISSGPQRLYRTVLPMP